MQTDFKQSPVFAKLSEDTKTEIVFRVHIES